MAGKGKSRAEENRAIRQEALREQLANKGLVQHVLEISKKLSDLTESLEPVEVQRLKAAADIQKGLISKYLPDMKMVELSGEVVHKDEKQLTDDELANIATAGSTGTTKQKNSKKELH